MFFNVVNYLNDNVILNNECLTLNELPLITIYYEKNVIKEINDNGNI